MAKSKTLDELKQSLASNGSAEQTPEAQSLRIAELCEMKDSIVNQVKTLPVFLHCIFWPPVLFVINLLHGMAGTGTKKMQSILYSLPFKEFHFKSLL